LKINHYYDMIYRMKRRLKIKLLLVQLISIVPFLIFIFYLFDLWFDTSRSMVLKENIGSAKLTATLINNSFRNGLTTAEILSTDPIFLESLAENKDEATLILKNILAKNQSLEAITVRDKEGKLLSATLELSAEQKQISAADMDFFQETIRGKRTVLSNPQKGKFTGKPIIAMTAPVVKNSETTAVVSTAYSLSYLKNLIEKNIISANERTIIVFDKNGQIVFISNQPFPSAEEKTLLADLLFVKEVQAGRVAFLENQKIPLIDKNVIGAAMPIDNFGWGVVSVEPITNVFAPIFKLQSIVWVIIFVGLLFSLSFITYFLRKVQIIY